MALIYHCEARLINKYSVTKVITVKTVHDNNIHEIITSICFLAFYQRLTRIPPRQLLMQSWQIMVELISAPGLQLKWKVIALNFVVHITWLNLRKCTLEVSYHTSHRCWKFKRYPISGFSKIIKRNWLLSTETITQIIDFSD